jgi:hypothetical protein
MREITRRAFLKRSGAAAVGAGLGAIGAVGTAAPPGRAEAEAQDATTGDGAQPSSGEILRVPTKVEYQRSWLTWVASAAGCLRALGVACDHIDVAGHSGYAFSLVVDENAGEGGPTSVDFLLLASGVSSLGRSTLAFTGATCGGTEDDHRIAHGLVKQEVAAGRPCVLWGAYMPEFAIALGVQDDSYIVESFRAPEEPQPPIRYNELAVCSGVHVLAFPAPAKKMRIERDRMAVHHALNCLSYRTGLPKHASGQAGYEQWIACLEAGNLDPWGHSYNTQCWAEAKRFGRDFLERVAERSGAVAEPLRTAAAAYAEVTEAMGRMARLFPPGDPERNAEKREARAEAIQALRAAKEAEARSARALADCAAAWPA